MYANNVSCYLTPFFIKPFSGNTCFNYKVIYMFGIFKKKSEKQKLETEYKQLLEEAFMLSKTNRRASDEKQAEAEQILDRIKKLEAEND